MLSSATINIGFFSRREAPYEGPSSSAEDVSTLSLQFKRVSLLKVGGSTEVGRGSVVQTISKRQSFVRRA